MGNIPKYIQDVLPQRLRDKNLEDLRGKFAERAQAHQARRDQLQAEDPDNVPDWDGVQEQAVPAAAPAAAPVEQAQVVDPGPAEGVQVAGTPAKGRRN